MNNANPAVDVYFADGCGRCPLGGTDDCKARKWQKELLALRRIVLDCGLQEERKWGVAVYTYEQNNVAVVSALKDYAMLGFFKGSLLQDTHNALHKPGENTQGTRMFQFTNIKDIVKLESVIKAYIYEAIEIERAGLKVEYKKNPEPIPEELEQKMKEDPALKAAFKALTPGRQRGYILYFSAPKQSKTRIARIEKHIKQILAGKGLYD